MPFTGQGFLYSRKPLVMGLNNESFEPVVPLDDVLSPEAETVWGTRGGSSECEVMIEGRGKNQGEFFMERTVWKIPACMHPEAVATVTQHLSCWEPWKMGLRKIKWKSFL